MRPRYAAAAFAGITAAVLAACGPPRLPQPHESLVVRPAWLAVRLADPEVVVLQVDREARGYDAEHVPGARFVALDAIVVTRDGLGNELPPPERLDSVLEGAGVSSGSRIVIYGDPLAAARLFFTLDYLGLGARAALLDGGLPRWKAEGLPVSDIPWAGPPGRLEWTLQPEVVADAAWVRAHLGDPAVPLLDARPAGDFRPHIPGASSLPWRTLLAAPKVPVLAESAVVARLFRQAGVDPGEMPVVYCRTGMQASFLYFAARYLGHTPRLYDGSFADWSSRPGYPVEQ
jgi:thiosulfate/3-mercaptopyruvate sulfurtransferase